MTSKCTIISEIVSREGQKTNRIEKDWETTQQFKLELTKEHAKQEFDPRQS